MTQPDRAEFLKGLGLNPDGDTLTALPQAPAQPQAPTPVANDLVLAPPGIDPHTMPVEDIVFDPRLLDAYTDLAFDRQGSVASRYIFDLYKSTGRNKERNGALQRKITSFITTTRRSRETGGLVTESIATTREQRDLAATLAAAGVSNSDLAEALKLLAAQRNN